MTADRLAALLTEAPGVERASRLISETVPVSRAFEEVLPEGGLRPGSTVAVGGIGRTSLALALVARASADRWTAVVGLPSLGLVAATELGIDLDRVVIFEEARPEVFASVVDAFDLVLAPPPPQRSVHKLVARVRERNAVLVTIGHIAESDVHLEGAGCTWHGIDRGHGHLAARTVDVVVSGRRGAARPRRARVWLPDHAGDIAVAADVAPLARSG